MKLLTPQPILELFKLSSFVCLDFETTGLDPAACEIIEVGAIKVAGGKVTDSYHTLVSIEDKLPELITNLTGITQADLEGRPSFNDIKLDLIDFIGTLPIVAHNLSFDLGFLKEMLSRSGDFDLLDKLELDSDKHWDILLLARMMFPLFHSFRLESLIEVFHIKSEIQHRALEDARAEVQIFDRLLSRSLKLPNETLALLVSLTQGRQKFFSNFIIALHELKSKKKYLLAENPIPPFVVDYPSSRNILARNLNREDKKAFEFDLTRILSVFGEDGIFSKKLSAYEYRHEQVEMVKEICRAYQNQEFLLVEAGTGTGKSWAYLVPAIFWSQNHPAPVNRTVVSTNTKNLQEQIFYKDLPFLHDHLTSVFQAVLLKGRANYICLNRWFKFLSQIDFASDLKLVEEVLPLLVWVNETNTGDIEEVNWFNPQRSGKIWWQIRSDGYYCTGSACRYSDRCFVNRARRGAREADIVVINHSLLLSDLLSDNAVLSEYENLVIDEAHNFENIATQYLGADWSFWNINQILLSLDSNKTEDAGEINSLEKLLKGQSWLDEAELKTVVNNSKQVKIEAAKLGTVNSSFFQQLYQELIAQKLDDNGYTKKLRYKNWQNEYSDLTENTEQLFNILEQMLQEISRLKENLSAISSSKFSKENREIFDNNFTFIQGVGDSLSGLKKTLLHLLQNNTDEFVYWIECSSRKESQNIYFHSAPLEVSALLKEMLYDKLHTGIFTSATLSINQSFDFFEQRLGLNLLPSERRNRRIVGSPFNFEEQMCVLIPNFLPSPQQDRFVEISSQLIERALVATGRSALLLFTSYKMLNQFYEKIGHNLRMTGLFPVAQGISGSRNNLLRMLREKKARVLLGTHSFWEGIDLPGETLEILIITKLPFEVPSEPVVQARIEQIEQLDGNSFYDYSLPNAVLKFRQGLGRLIRNQQDRGVVILLDSRLINSRYGSVFLNSMPVSSSIMKNEEDFILNLKNWFSTE